MSKSYTTWQAVASAVGISARRLRDRRVRLDWPGAIPSKLPLSAGNIRKLREWIDTTGTLAAALKKLPRDPSNPDRPNPEAMRLLARHSPLRWIAAVRHLKIAERMDLERDIRRGVLIRKDEADASRAACWRGVRDGLKRAAKSLPGRLAGIAARTLGDGDGPAAAELEEDIHRELTAAFAAICNFFAGPDAGAPPKEGTNENAVK